MTKTKIKLFVGKFCRLDKLLTDVGRRCGPPPVTVLLQKFCGSVFEGL